MITFKGPAQLPIDGHLLVSMAMQCVHMEPVVLHRSKHRATLERCYHIDMDAKSVAIK